MQEIANTIFQVFAERAKVFEGKSAVAEAQKAAGEQAVLYQQLFQLARDIRYLDEAGASQPFDNKHLFDAMAAWCAGVLQRQGPGIFDGPDAAKIVRSPLPMFDQDRIDTLKQVSREPMPEAKARFIRNLVVVAPLVERRPNVPQPNFDETAPRARMDLMLALSDYAAAKNVAEFQPTIAGRVNEKVAVQQALLDRLESSRKKLAEKLVADKNTHGEMLDELDEKIIGEQDRMKELQGQLTSFEKSIRQELQLDRARETWSKRYSEARRSFKNTVWLLIAMVAIPFIAAFGLGPAVVRFVNNFDIVVLLGAGGTGAVFAHFLTRLVIISVPVFAYLWALRVVIRYFTRSMMLKDDARMRETMLDTYFTLTEAGRADADSRPIILNALFRPAPGHGTEGTEPPEVAAYLESLARMTRPA